MYIRKQYLVNNNSPGRLYLRISVSEDKKENRQTQDHVPFLKDMNDLYDSKDMRWINIKNLDDEEFLEKHNIECFSKENKSYNKREIYPVGMFEFNKGTFSSNDLRLYFTETQDLYRVEQVVKNIEEAIKIKYNESKFRNKFYNGITEAIEIQE